MRFNPFSSIASFSTALRASTSRVRLPARPSTRLFLPALPPAFVRGNHDVSLSSLKPSPGSTKNRRRVGRGVGSKMGGHTTGRGHKGQKSRSTIPYIGFEGGQTPLYQRIPKRGFSNPFRKTYASLSIAKIQKWIHQGRIDPTQPITIRTVIKSNVVHGIGTHAGVKLLGTVDESLPLPSLNISMSKFTMAAGRAIIKAGGTCTAVYHNRLSLMQELRPHKFIGREITPAKPVRRKDIEYYTDATKFGYLANERDKLFLDRGFDPHMKRSKVAGRPYKDTRGLTPEEAAAKDAELAKEKMANIMNIQMMRP
ncbi:ribosomal protein L18e/L15P [Kockovaella imperatae]|uniref:Ribosomal protein L18e/L15P n=1 Tax=Kockovaella imperatae TaxID=4999 RepID=A0A1Y1UTE3_9TREE|nr:ribosomal protein L18e/L15P [Kockovaella imperatae]ORX40696.1 ribosomal protein L18e/L15P [Kockovaella imperatae]